MEGLLYTADLLMQKDRQEKLEENKKVLDSVIDTIYTLIRFTKYAFKGTSR